MRPSRTIISLMLVAAVVFGASPATAQSSPLLRSADAAVRAAAAAPPQSTSKTTSVVTGAVIGAIAALAITGWAANSYGENEGGKFCYNCMLQWSALSVPVGAGLGAGLGFAVASIRHSAGPGARPPARSAGITFTTRF